MTNESATETLTDATIANAIRYQAPDQPEIDGEIDAILADVLRRADSIARSLSPGLCRAIITALSTGRVVEDGQAGQALSDRGLTTWRDWSDDEPHWHLTALGLATARAARRDYATR